MKRSPDHCRPEVKLPAIHEDLSIEELEALCLRCGRCCCAKIIIGDEVIYTPLPCPHLDKDTSLCAVYGHRWEVNPDCLTLAEGIAMGVFPADCPYVKDIPGYNPPREQMTQEEFFLWMDSRDEDRRAGE